MSEEVKNTEETKTVVETKSSIWRDIVWLIVGFVLGVAVTWCIMAATFAGTLNQLESYISGIAAGQVVQEQTVENAQ